MTHARRTLLTLGTGMVGTLALGVTAGVLGTAPAGAATSPSLPSGAARVVVHTARATTVAELELTDAAAISGRVTDPSSDGTALVGAVVTARDSAGVQVGTTSTTGFDGAYTILGLPRSTKGFAVCVMPTQPSGGPTYGYFGWCYKTNQLFLGGTPPRNTTYVPTVPGTTRTGIDLTSGPRGALRVTVDAPGINPGTLRSVTVRAYTTAGRLVASATGKGGSAPLVLRVPAARYHVCVDARASAAAAGVAGRCAGSLTSWVPGWPVPSAARTITTGYGNAVDVHVALLRGGSVNGTVRTAAGNVITHARVVAYRGGVAWARTTSAVGGAYSLRGLPTGHFRICSSGGYRIGSRTVFAAHCAGVVAVRAEHATNGVDVTRRRVVAEIGSIAGIVVDSAGRDLSDVRVDAYAPHGRLVATTTTTSRGRYVLAGIPATDTGYRVCFSGLSAGPASNTPRPRTGYSSQCYSNVRWSRGAVPTGRTTPVTVTAGRIHRGVDATLQRGGLLRGKVSFNGVPLAGSRIYIADSNRTIVDVTTTDGSGRYTVTDLTPSLAGYYVCAFGGSTGSASTSGRLGYRGRCTGNVAWDAHLR